MKSDNYVVIQGWMCNELELKGNDLLVFALIHGFSQDGESRFSGSRSYIAETFNISLPTVDRAIKNLIEKKLIEQHKEERNGIIYNSYNSLPPVKKLYPSGKETLPNKIDNKDSSNKTNSKELVQNFEFGKTKPKPKKENLYSKCVAMIDDFLQDRLDAHELKPLLIQYLNLRLEMSEATMYANQWKGLLNKLLKVWKENPDNEMCDIIQQSIDRGYKSFFPVNRGNSLRTESGSRNVPTMTEQDYDRQLEWITDMESKGVKVRF